MIIFPMKRLIIAGTAALTLGLILLALGLIWLPTGARAQISIEPRSLTEIDREQETWDRDVMTFEADYYRSRGRYYQMLWSHTDTPDTTLLTARTAPDNLVTRPTDQTETAVDLWTATRLPLDTPYRFRVDVYEGPRGHGYVITLQTEVNRQIWQKSINYGPETYRNTDWHAVIEEREAAEIIDVIR